MMASAARNIFREVGTRLPRSVMTAREKAMSVAEGIAQPRIDSADEKFSAALSYRNFHAVQFHTEKSGAVGERVLENFLNI